MTVRVELLDGKIAAEVPWDGGRGRDLAKQAGGRWSQPKKRWMFSLNWEQCVRLREVFGPALEIGPKLSVWARQEKGRRDEINLVQEADLSEVQTIPRIEKHVPRLATAMYSRGYQTVVPAFAKLVDNFLLADVPGLGKCIETLGALIETGRQGRVLIVCPKTAMRATWVNEIEKWLPPRTYTLHVCEGTAEERNETIRAYLRNPPPRGEISFQFLVVNAEMLRQPFVFRDKKRIDNVDSHGKPKPASHPMLFHVPWDAVIGDEVHKYLLKANPRAQSGGGLNQVGLGFCQLRFRDGNGRIALTGTPMKGKPKNLWGTLRWLEPQRYSSEWKWTGTYYEAEENRYSNTGISYTDKLKEGAEAALAKELSTIMLRRTKTELRKINPGWAPPDKQYIEVWVDLSQQQQKIYDQVLQDAEIKLNNQILPVNGILAILTRLKQAAGCAAKLEKAMVWRSLKLPDGKDATVQVPELTLHPQMPSAKFDWLVDTFLPSRGIEPKGAGQGTNKVVVASQFTSFIKLWRAELETLGIPCFALTGETSNQDRQNEVADFQNNPFGPRVYLLNTNAGGVSITLDKFADDVVIMDETWVPDDQLQVEDRVHRTSNPDHFVNVTYVRSRNTVEEEIAATVAEKDYTQMRILDGERGVQWAVDKFGVKPK